MADEDVALGAEPGPGRAALRPEGTALTLAGLEAEVAAVARVAAVGARVVLTGCQRIAGAD